MIRWVCSI
ncbi:hypothetical protein MTR67_052620 [Solanum verrucosum]|uniref:Uncharacterized protein n=1 Tax=Solanum verrucosum TaxID=315347 RepID=A0AAF0V783_SOLVR|nr:hypothetical protein MTR67_052620 [Solanum verrucosum]